MDNIKSLYLTARNSGRDSDISAYNEAVNSLLNSDPKGYISNLEYIIQSSSGVNTFKEFTEKYGFSISLYNEAMKYVESAIDKCINTGKDYSDFEEFKEWMESFRNDHLDEFKMYEYYIDNNDESYCKTYYGSNKNNIQNSKLPAGMIKQFGEAAVPDMLIESKKIGSNTYQKMLSYVESYDKFDNPLFYEYLSHVAPLSKEITEKTASSIIIAMQNKNKQLFRESVINDDIDAQYEYSQQELDAIDAKIAYDEYSILFTDDDKERAMLESDALSLYNELDGLEYEFDEAATEANKSKDDLVPIFILLRHYDNNIPDELKNDPDFERSVNLCKLINKLAKGDQYSHCVLSFDEGMTQMYSFEANGIVHDNLDTKFWKFISSVYMSVMFIKKEEKDKLLKMCQDYIKHPETTSYAYSELVRMYLGKPIKANGNFICSSFAAYLLAAADPKNLHRDYSRMRPEDIELLPRTFYIGNWKNGTDIEKKKGVIHQKVKAIKDEHMDELKDYNNELPKYMLEDACKKKRFFDKIIDYIVGTKLSRSMGGSQWKKDKKNKNEEEIKESYESIFVEATEEKGILFKGYKPLLGYINAFLTVLTNYIEELNTEPDKSKIDLNTKISEFKKDINIHPEPLAIVIPKINKQIATIKDYRSETDKSLKVYINLRNKIAYGGGLNRSILHRPKVMDNSIDPERYETVNNNIRNVNRAMDWVEKCFIDLYNFIDQDLNILNIINRVYAKQHIYEGVNVTDDGDVEEWGAASITDMLPSATGEATSTHAWFNTRDKKTSTAPSYLKNNHDMAKWGEEDDDDQKNDDEASLDDYKRPSANDDTIDDSSADDEDIDDDEDTGKKNDNNVNNYYYYTYDNSFNKSKDDHSSHSDNHSSNDDHSTKVTLDDHSTNKSNSDYYKGNPSGTRGKTHAKDKDKDNDFHELESMLTIHIPGIDDAIMEDVAPVDDRKPVSDHPVKDTLMDIDRKTTKVQQSVKKGVQDAENVGRAAMKPINRAKDWIGNEISKWKDKSETQIKEDMADPHSRNILFKAIRKSIEIGALKQAGLLLNPVFLALAGGHAIKNHKDKFRIRNEMIGELKTEMEITDEKIKDADASGDNKAKYELMRFKNELNKKLLRVGGSKGWNKIF